MNLPEKYTESMKMMLGDEYDSYIESFNDKRLYGLRVNNLKISTEVVIANLSREIQPWQPGQMRGNWQLVMHNYEEASITRATPWVSRLWKRLRCIRAATKVPAVSERLTC